MFSRRQNQAGSTSLEAARANKRSSRVYTALLAVTFSLLVACGVAQYYSPAYAANIAPASVDDWGSYQRYNAFIFGEMDIQGGGRVGGAIATAGNIHLPNPNPFNLGYDLGTAGPTTFNGDNAFAPYENEIVPGDPPRFRYPTLITGAQALDTDGNDQNWDHVYDGNMVATESFMELNDALFGFQLSGDGVFQSATQASIDDWFASERMRALNASHNYLLAGNDAGHRISFADYSSGAYTAGGSERFKNTSLTVDGQVYENVLLITVETDENISLPSWWPTEEFFHINVPWVEQYDLVVYNFPDVINVDAQSGAFVYEGGILGAQVGQPWNNLSAAQQEERIALGSKLIVNFPNAQNITFHPDVFHGSILAPEADARFYGGVLVGSLVVDNYTSIEAHTLSPVVLVDLALEIAEEGIGSIEVAKFLLFNGQELGVHLSGAEFVLVKKEGVNEQFFDGAGSFVDLIADAAVYTIPASGEIGIDQVPPGSYWLRETFTPEAFAPPSEDVEVVVAADETARVEIFNDPLVRDVAFTKIESNTATPLEGAEFQLYRESDDFYGGTWLVGTFTSDASGSLLAPGLPVGTYFAVEVASPLGYELMSAPLEFQILVENGLLVVRDAAGNPFATDPIAIENVLGTPDNRIMVSKIHTDAEGVERVLSDARFDLYRWLEVSSSWELVTVDGAGILIDIATNELGYYTIDGLALGIYRLVETQAPPGFHLSNPTVDPDFPNGFSREFEVGADVSQVVEIENEILTTELELWKVGPDFDSWLPDPSAAPLLDLEGASFRLEKLVDEEGTTWAELVEQDTGADGRTVFAGITQGSYRLTEFASPLGYALKGPLSMYVTVVFDANEEAQITALYDGQAVTDTTSPVSVPSGSAQLLIKVSNAALVHDLWIVKRSNETPVRYLEGAVFQIQRSEAGSAGPWSDYGDEITSLFVEEGGAPVLDANGIQVAAAHFLVDPGLVGGWYRVAEVEPPPGFEPGSHEIISLDGGRQGSLLFDFLIVGRTIVAGGSVPGGELSAFGGSITFNAVNRAITPTVSLRITKTDVSGAQALPGAQFLLFDFQGFAQTAYTDVYGEVLFNDLEEGSYLLSETIPPLGFPRVDNWMWTVEVDPNASSADPLIPARILIVPDQGHPSTAPTLYAGVDSDDIENFFIRNIPFAPEPPDPDEPGNLPGANKLPVVGSSLLGLEVTGIILFVLGLWMLAWVARRR